MLSAKGIQNNADYLTDLVVGADREGRAGEYAEAYESSTVKQQITRTIERNATVLFLPLLLVVFSGSYTRTVPISCLWQRIAEHLLCVQRYPMAPKDLSCLATCIWVWGLKDLEIVGIWDQQVFYLHCNSQPSDHHSTTEQCHCSDEHARYEQGAARRPQGETRHIYPPLEGPRSAYQVPHFAQLPQSRVSRPAHWRQAHLLVLGSHPLPRPRR
jgi:hypothetical protein